MEIEKILSDIFILNLIVIGIAALVMVCKELLRDRRVCPLKIESGREIEVPAGTSLLAAFFNEGIYLPSGCGGKGTCGYCKVKVKSGGGRPLGVEKSFLSKKELKENFRLACQVNVQGQIVIQLPFEYTSIKVYKAEISEISTLCAGINRFVLKLKVPEKIEFRAGQYIQILLSRGNETIIRGYSIANSPSENDKIELNVQLVESGVMSPYLFERRPGDEIEFTGPCGDFRLGEEDRSPLIFVGGGIGITPIKPILEDLCLKKKLRKIFLFWGTRDLKRLYYHQFFLELSKRNPNISYFPVIQENDPTWAGRRGLVTYFLKTELPETAEGKAFLCGPSKMVEEAFEILRQKGLQKESIYSDKF